MATNFGKSIESEAKFCQGITALFYDFLDFKVFSMLFRWKRFNNTAICKYILSKCFFYLIKNDYVGKIFKGTLIQDMLRKINPLICEQ